MMKTNPQLQGVIATLRKKAHTEQSNFWLRVAEDLTRPTRRRVIVNLARINRIAQDGEIIVVPGKVLAAGELDKKVTVVAWQFSGNAREKIGASGNAMDLLDLAQQGITGKKVRIVG